MVPTVLDALNLEPPETIRGVQQSPLEGVSFADTFDAPAEPSRHVTQYYEMFGHRSIYHDGWRAVCPWPGPSYAEAAELGRKVGDPITPEILEQLDRDGWELYDVATDPTETYDVAADNQDRVRELIALWWQEAEKYKVLPLDGSLQTRLAAERPQTSAPRTRFVYYPGTSIVPAFAAPPIFNRPYSIEAKVEIPEQGAEGVIIAQGGEAGGYALYVQNGLLRHHYNYLGRRRFDLESKEALSPGPHTVRYEFEPTGAPDIRAGRGAPGLSQLYIDGNLVANAELPYTVPLIFELEGLSCGCDSGAPAGEGYSPPFAFTGTLHEVVVEVAGELIQDDEATIAKLMAQQ
jgi:hypothetical protein